LREKAEEFFLVPVRPVFTAIVEVPARTECAAGGKGLLQEDTVNVAM
jgi:hypothetical protein